MKTVLLIIPAVALLAAGCNTAWQANKPPPVAQTATLTPLSVPTPAPTPTTVNPSKWIIYKNPALGFTLKYPYDWTVENIQPLNDAPNRSKLLTGMFAISTYLPTIDHNGEPMNDTAQFGIAVETIPGVSIEQVTQEIAHNSNYTLGKLTAEREAQDGPSTVSTTIHLVTHRTLLRITYSWSALSSGGGEDMNATANKQRILDTFSAILASFE